MLLFGAMVLGGIGSSFFDSMALIVLLFVGIVVSLLFYYLANSCKDITLKDLGIYAIVYGTVVCLELFSFLLSKNGDFLLLLSNKHVDLGWSESSNNVALLLLFVIPFVLYLLVKAKNIIWSLFVNIFFLLFVFTLIITYSRGSILAFVVLEVPLFIFLIVKNYRNRNIFIMVGIDLLVMIAFGFYLSSINRLESIMQFLQKFDLQTFNGRRGLYERVNVLFKQYPIFGIGLGAGVDSKWGPEFAMNGYLFAHGTFYQSALSMGVVGILAMTNHLFYKYKNLFRYFRIESLIFISAFLATDFYGLFDVSYFNWVYMALLIPFIIYAERLFIEVPQQNQITL
jgi:hypothetical protein